jgi:flagellar basal body rod protein FlgB
MPISDIPILSMLRHEAELRRERGGAGDTLAHQRRAPRERRWRLRMPSGNGVSLEDQMTKVASNQMDFQAASAVCARRLGLIPNGDW